MNSVTLEIKVDIDPDEISDVIRRYGKVTISIVQTEKNEVTVFIEEINKEIGRGTY
ncbi:MAG: hypothetical protein GSR82_00155 [Desulfurococcales archaeon]|nr:hypothetical protein [Desulfurococcales archaeon]